MTKEEALQLDDLRNQTEGVYTILRILDEELTLTRFRGANEAKKGRTNAYFDVL